MIETQQAQQGQINDLRNAYTRTAPMGTFLRFEEDVRQRLANVELRTTSLESGTLAAVTARLDADAAARITRQAETDRAAFWRTVLLIAVLIALAAVAGLELWVALR